MLRRLLFVDDEPFIRELYASLEPVLGSGHEVHTAAGAREALELLEQKRFDVVVSDLAMPEVDGMAFLHQVVADHPEAARIIVSGFADRLKVAQCLTIGHRFFNKPFDFKTLATLLRRICQYSHLVTTDRLRKIVGGAGALPSVPENYLRLTEILASPFADLEEISRIVEQDPGLCTKLIHVVNSAEFGQARQIVTPSEAVQCAGVEIIKALMLGLGAFQFYEENPFQRKTFKDLWNHSITAAVRARRLALAQGLSTIEVEQCFLAGLLHDIGKLILAANAQREYSVAVELSEKAVLPLEQAEMGIFATTHAHIGAYLLALWGLPDAVIQAVELHHSLDPSRIHGFNAALAVHLAQNLHPDGARRRNLNTALLAQLGLEECLPAWEEALSETT
jgi:putative nucleotidyltransferase with HDIG domain